MNDARPIGIFDSGIGGLTVFQAISQVLPKENLVYFGDTARVPYGDKSPDTVIQYAIENAEFLSGHSIKALVIACNTATAYSLDTLQNQFSFPIIGVIEPGAQQAAQLSSNKQIGVIGTRGTVRSGAYEKAIYSYVPHAKIFSVACPLLIPLVEENFMEHPATHLIVKTYLEPIKKSDIDTLLLGCTHYPFLQKIIAEELGNQVRIIDSATACAHQVKSLLQEQCMENKSNETPSYSYFVSDDPEKFQRMGSRFLSLQPTAVCMRRGYLVVPEKGWLPREKIASP